MARTAVAAITAALLGAAGPASAEIVAGGPAPAGPPAATRQGCGGGLCHDKSPVVEGCVGDAVTLNEVTLNAVPPATRLQHRYSARCDASWARVQSTIKARAGTLSIENDEYVLQGASGEGEW
ncbi:DUF2690 domain-containing protein [Actinomadura sediminis]|uniref:DUF2690 domain-containing protein n=1 Tax=Actinomadura sediminis TaxID=1038904 RepID=A0ABW3EY10_9ACTN